MNEHNNTSGGVGFMSLLGILFIALKLTGVIDWPWIAVLAPIWGSIVFWLVVAVVAVIIASRD